MSTPERSSTNAVLEPEEPLLTKYSRHHELPISTLISIVTHALVALVAFVAGAAFFSWNSERSMPAIGSLYVNDYKGGGGKEGQGGLDGPKETALRALPADSNLPSLFPVTEGDPEPFALPSNTQALKNIEKDARAKAGSRGTGGGVGGGNGKGTGDEDGDGVGTKKRPKRVLRMDRWQLAINYADGADYLAKLANLQAIIAYPAEEKQFRLFADLSPRPLQSELVTADRVGKLNRIYWSNSDKDAVSGLVGAMGLAARPSIIYFLFPRSLEDELLRSELAHANLTEDEINAKRISTKFHAERQGDKWVVKVLEQKQDAVSKSK